MGWEFWLAVAALGFSALSALYSGRSADAAKTSARFAKRWAKIDAVKRRAEVADEVLVAALAVIDDMGASFREIELSRGISARIDGTEWEVDERQARIIEVYRSRHLCTVHMPDAEKTILEVAEAAQGLLGKQQEYIDFDKSKSHTDASYPGWLELYREAADEERLRPMIEALRTKVLMQLQPIATLTEG